MRLKAPLPLDQDTDKFFSRLASRHRESDPSTEGSPTPIEAGTRAIGAVALSHAWAQANRNCETAAMDLRHLFDHEAFPRASRYDAEWIIENEMGPNVLWITEALCEVMNLESGMRVLDLGCGSALSSVFLAREYDVQVWATDLWISARENAERIRDAGLDGQVFPIHADARSLPYATDFFDAVVSMDSYHYFGTDVHYLEFHLLRLVKPGGRIGIVSPAAQQPGPLPAHLPASEWYWINSIDWWRQHWERYPEIEVEVSEALVGGWDLWVRWLEALKASGRASRPEETKRELAQLREDGGAYLGFVRQVGRRVGPD